MYASFPSHCVNYRRLVTTPFKLAVIDQVDVERGIRDVVEPAPL
jgi:hypothetical protein